MSTVLALALWTTVVGGLVYLLLKWLDLARFTSRFPRPGMPLPFLGNTHLLFGVPPEEILPKIKEICHAADPEKRKVAFGMGNTKMIFLFHPETVEPVFKSTVHTVKSYDYNPLLCWLGEGLLLSRGDKWRNRRKLLYAPNSTLLCHLLVYIGFLFY